MIESYRLLGDRMAVVRALETLRKKADPASGITIQVRRGAIGSDEPPEWTMLEIGVGFEKVLDLMIADQRESAKFFARILQDDLAKGANVLRGYDQFK